MCCRYVLVVGVAGPEQVLEELFVLLDALGADEVLRSASEASP